MVIYCLKVRGQLKHNISFEGKNIFAYKVRVKSCTWGVSKTPKSYVSPKNCYDLTNPNDYSIGEKSNIGNIIIPEFLADTSQEKTIEKEGTFEGPRASSEVLGAQSENTRNIFGQTNNVNPKAFFLDPEIPFNLNGSYHILSIDQSMDNEIKYTIKPPNSTTTTITPQTTITITTQVVKRTKTN